MKKILTEPLTHFLFVGLIIFIAYAKLNPTDEGGSGSSSHTPIEMDRASYQKLQNLLAADESSLEGQDKNAGEEFLDKWLEDVVLLEEAYKRGLHLNDRQIATRLKQKMRMALLSSLPATDVVSDEAVDAYIETHREKLLLPAAYSFLQIYFGKELPDEDTQVIAELFAKHGDQTEDELRLSLKDYAVEHRLPYFHQLRDAKTIDQIFGKGFSETIQQLEVGLWSGPIESGFGWHWLRKTDFKPQALPEEKVLHAHVRQRVISLQSEKNYRAEIDRIKANYDVVFPVAGSEK